MRIHRQKTHKRKDLVLDSFTKWLKFFEVALRSFAVGTFLTWSEMIFTMSYMVTSWEIN